MSSISKFNKCFLSIHSVVFDMHRKVCSTEVSPEEAHKIGVEWAEKVFGRDHQVIVTTHVDRSHIHNHFAVAAYNLDGRKWYGNKSTLKHCREISDKICMAHGLSIIEKPQYNANQRYSEWLARQTKSSWKQQLCDDIDKLILLDNVKSVDNLAERLRGKGYIVSFGKHLSVKAAKNRKAIRTYRLGDGYAIEELRYRIEHKEHEMSIYAVSGYQGIQREYAMCLRELQIMFYRKEEMPHKATYSELRKNSELLTFLFDNHIHSVSDFENRVNVAADKANELKKEREKLLQSIEEKEKIMENGTRYLELVHIRIPTSEQLNEMSKLSYLTKYRLRSESDIDIHRQKLEELKSKLAETENSLADAEKIKTEVSGNYQTYLRQMQTDYDFILEKIKREQEEIRQAEQERQREQSRQERRERARDQYCI